MPGARLHGLLASGSAAAAVVAPTAPTLMAPASAAPCDSSARRSTRPLPATLSTESAPLRCRDLVMFRSPRRHTYRAPTGPDASSRMLRHNPGSVYNVAIESA